MANLRSTLCAIEGVEVQLSFTLLTFCTSTGRTYNSIRSSLAKPL
jgi:hypothetical protein